MMLAFDRQKNVVFPLALSAETPRAMAGCCGRNQPNAVRWSRTKPTKGMMRRASSICSLVPPCSWSSFKHIALGLSG